MKKWIIALLAAALGLSLAAALAEQTGVANPWVEADAEQVEAAVGAAFGVPEGAENVSYRLLTSECLAEMDFSWYGMDYYARIRPAEGFVDLSGLYFDPWDVSMDVEVGGCAGTEERVEADGLTWNRCQWYDADAGLMYCVATSGEDLDGFDILAAAEAIYAPAA